MINQIQIDEQYKWFQSVECSTYPEPFLSIADYYIVYSDVNPDLIKENELELHLKMTDINLDLGDGSSLFMQMINLEKIYAYMLKKELTKNDKANNSIYS